MSPSKRFEATQNELIKAVKTFLKKVLTWLKSYEILETSKGFSIKWR